MLDVYLPMASLLVVALLLGGMFLFAGGFAAFLFRYLPPNEARLLIRKAFPPFYLFVIVSSGVNARNQPCYGFGIQKALFVATRFFCSSNAWTYCSGSGGSGSYVSLISSR